MKKTIILYLICCFTLPLIAKKPVTYQHPSTGTTITFPGNWHVFVGAKSIIGTGSAELDTPFVDLKVVEKMTIVAASKMVECWISEHYTQLDISDINWGYLNGMKTYSFRFRGLHDGNDSRYGIAMLVQGPKGVAFLHAAYMVELGGLYLPIIDKIFESFSKMKKFR